jgi:hypothetical protein
MARRNTTTGAVLETMILPALKNAGYHHRRQVNIGHRLGGGRVHLIDALAWNGDTTFLISLKWQQTSGTAEQKVPFEVICLADAVRSDQRGFGRIYCADCYELHSPDEAHDLRSYLVLGGEGWSLRDFYTNGGLDRHLVRPDLVRIVSLEGFIAKANQREL